MPALHSQADGPQAPARPAILLSHCGIMALVTLAGLTWPWSFADVSVDTLVYAMSVVLLVFYGWCFWSWAALTGSWFDPYSIFLGAANLFNAGQAFLEVFHLNPLGILPGLFTPVTILRTLFLVFLGLASLHLGALLSVGKAPGPASEADTPDSEASPSAADVRLAGWLLLLLSVVPTFLLLREAVDLVLSAGYLALYQRELAVGFNKASALLATFLVPAALFMLAGGKGAPATIAVSGLTILCNACCQLFLGYRYYAVMPLVAYLWIWHQCIRPVPRWALLATGAALVFIVFPIVSVTREVRGEERLSLEFLARAFSSIDNPAVRTVSEMGGSMRTVAYTLELVPAERPHEGGGVYLYGLLTVVPNLFWDVHPAMAYGTSSDWLIWTVDPDTAAQGGALGYSFIAEAYFNFGWLGVPLVTGLLGWLYGRFVRWGLRPAQDATAKLALVGCFASFFTFYAREDVAVVFRSLVWFSLGPYALAYLVFWLRQRPARARLATTMVQAGVG